MKSKSKGPRLLKMALVALLFLTVVACEACATHTPPAPGGVVFAPEVVDMLGVLHRGSVMQGLEFSACLVGRKEGSVFYVTDVSAATIVERRPDIVKVDCRLPGTGLWHSHVLGALNNACMLSRGDVALLQERNVPVMAITCDDGDEVFLFYRTPASVADMRWQ